MEFLEVVYRTIPTSNHNYVPFRSLKLLLYIVLFLHQTTTCSDKFVFPSCCISYYSYIKPQPWDCLTEQQRSCISYYSYIKPQRGYHQGCPAIVVYRTIPTSNHNLPVYDYPTVTLYIVLFLHQTTTASAIRDSARMLYIVLFLHQTTTIDVGILSGIELYIVLFLHQTTTLPFLPSPSLCCISYYSYIKPQLGFKVEVRHEVVYRTIPTSNHNRGRGVSSGGSLYIVLFLHQTTTH